MNTAHEQFWFCLYHPSIIHTIKKTLGIFQHLSVGDIIIDWNNYVSNIIESIGNGDNVIGN